MADEVKFQKTILICMQVYADSHDPIYNASLLLSCHYLFQRIAFGSMLCRLYMHHLVYNATTWRSNSHRTAKSMSNHAAQTAHGLRGILFLA